MADTQENRRRHERHKLDRGAEVRSASGAAHGGRVSDVSASGVALKGFEAPHGLGAGDEIVVEIEGGGEGEDGKVVRAGRVVRAVEDFVAVSFEDLYEHEELAELGIDVPRDAMFD
ncbi:MAG: PilZ domain-containing protein [Rhodospirillales bacterium]